MNILDNVLPRDALAKARMLMERVAFDPGARTAGLIAAATKTNLQARASGKDAADLAALVQRALLGDERFTMLSMPRRLHLSFNRYERGMEYGPHFDAGVVGAGAERAVRTDLSLTLFLTGPDEYDGGELHIETPYGESVVKLPAGDAVLYHGNMRHWVTPVTNGVRAAAFGWIQSMVQDREQRRVVAELNMLRRELAQAGVDTNILQRASRAYQDLLRLWAQP